MSETNNTQLSYIIELFGQQLIDKQTALLLKSPIADEEGTCLSVLFPEHPCELGMAKHIAHQFEEGFAPQVFPTCEYTILEEVSIPEAYRRLTFARKERLLKEWSGYG